MAFSSIFAKKRPGLQVCLINCNFSLAVNAPGSFAVSEIQVVGGDWSILVLDCLRRLVLQICKTPWVECIGFRIDVFISMNGRHGSHNHSSFWYYNLLRRKRVRAPRVATWTCYVRKLLTEFSCHRFQDDLLSPIEHDRSTLIPTGLNLADSVMKLSVMHIFCIDCFVSPS